MPGPQLQRYHVRVPAIDRDVWSRQHTQAAEMDLVLNKTAGSEHVLHME